MSTECSMSRMWRVFLAFWRAGMVMALWLRRQSSGMFNMGWRAWQVRCQQVSWHKNSFLICPNSQCAIPCRISWVQLYWREKWTRCFMVLIASHMVVYSEAPLVMWMVMSPVLDPNTSLFSLGKRLRFLIKMPLIILGTISRSRTSSCWWWRASETLVMAQTCSVNSGILVLSCHLACQFNIHCCCSFRCPLTFIVSIAMMIPSRKCLKTCW